MSPTVWLMVSVAVGLVVGYLLHEVAHYAPLKAAGYDATVSWWPPQVEFESELPAPPIVRVAAVAPAVVGATLIGAGVVFVNQLSVFTFGFLVGVCIRLCWLSQVDRVIAVRGMLTK
ncbi:hypothetical protein Hbl1158_17000 (plasmid) [Halobaculum sp. CBA1158]|uniref:hypothetical protein n=1 Tax=Halobaculum sp. CBA1158 TaxID=2904243 RepID=UPI001F2809EF|nr:hypothetical protein [Halobaculum sp. CBA1158]UIP01701.1 hypothetical protein Hbl1158_17000 [Halobaculum sp. CBA1158]